MSICVTVRERVGELIDERQNGKYTLSAAAASIVLHNYFILPPNFLLQVFRAPSPWTMAIMNVLAELHQEPDLKLNLKFEIEVLCKTLGLDVNDLKPTTYLKDPNRMATLEVQVRSRLPQSQGKLSYQCPR